MATREKDIGAMSLREMSKLNEEQARAYLEKIRWPDGPVCVHCGSVNVALLKGKATRPGVYKCKEKECRRQFTVTVGTIFERSHIDLKTWLMAFHIVTSAKKGISALQLQRQLGLGSYKSAWHMAHRIRHAMDNGPLKEMLGGGGKDVYADETFVGGKPGNRHGGRRPKGGKRPSRKGVTAKCAVVGLIERGGRAVALPIGTVNHERIHAFMRENVSMDSRLVTDEAHVYKKIGREFQGGHETLNHARYEYVRRTPLEMLTTNEIESFWSLLKRGITGSFHHISERHMHRYCDEFAFRWSYRKITDSERRDIALRMTEGRRLMYRESSSAGA